MNKLFIVPSNIFTFSFLNHRPAQAVIFLSFIFNHTKKFPVSLFLQLHRELFYTFVNNP